MAFIDFITLVRVGGMNPEIQGSRSSFYNWRRWPEMVGPTTAYALWPCPGPVHVA